MIDPYRNITHNEIRYKPVTNKAVYCLTVIDLDTILDLFEEKNAFFVYTGRGRGPSQTSFLMYLLQDVSIGLEFLLKMIKHVMYMRKDA